MLDLQPEFHSSASFFIAQMRDAPNFILEYGLRLHLRLHLKNVVANFVDLRLWKL